MLRSLSWERLLPKMPTETVSGSSQQQVHGEMSDTKTRCQEKMKVIRRMRKHGFFNSSASINWVSPSPFPQQNLQSFPSRGFNAIHRTPSYPRRKMNPVAIFCKIFFFSGLYFTKLISAAAAPTRKLAPHTMGWDAFWARSGFLHIRRLWLRPTIRTTTPCC